MSRTCLLLALLPWAAFPLEGAIRVSPHWVNINTVGVTTVFLTFGDVTGFLPAEAVWCGEIMNAGPDIGDRPVPGTIFGSLPARYDRSRFSGTGGFTDIMSIPASVARRAYQAAAGGERSTFFYVRRFISTSGGPDEYVAVSCELSGGGARSPFAVTGVNLSFENGEILPSVRAGAMPPSLSATLSYTGTGQLQGRWEVVRPGDTPPSEADLLTEGSLPAEQRASQRRYPEVERFSVFLPPTGLATLRGPDPSRLPSGVSGVYMVLLRIETAADVEAQSDLAGVGAGPAEVSTGAAAGFAIPPLRYVVGEGPGNHAGVITQLEPRDMSVIEPGKPVELSWTSTAGGVLGRVVLIDPSNVVVAAALKAPGAGMYHLPPWIWTTTDAHTLSWSIEALDDDGRVITKSPWRTLIRPPLEDNR